MFIYNHSSGNYFIKWNIQIVISTFEVHLCSPIHNYYVKFFAILFHFTHNITKMARYTKYLLMLLEVYGSLRH